MSALPSSSSSSAALGLPFLQPGQALKHITINEALAALDLLVQLAVISLALAAPPPEPAEGDAYIIPDGGADWPGQPSDVAVWRNGGWACHTPRPGWRAWVVEAQAIYVFGDGGWTPLAADSVPTLGVNAAADPTNRLSVASDAVLFSHDGGDQRTVLNKASPTDTATVLFQTGFSGRAEMGLAGEDEFSFKVSADGQDFATAFTLGSNGDTHRPAGRSFVMNLVDDDPDRRFTLRTNSRRVLFEKPTSDADRFEGSAFQFDQCGGQNTGTPALQGLICTSTNVSYGGNASQPQALFFWSYTDKDDPTDLRFNIHTTVANGPSDIALRTRSGGNVLIQADAVGIGSLDRAPQAKLDVDGPIRPKSYTLAALPAASGLGAGAIAYVSDAPGGPTLAFTDGQDWRAAHDRSVI